jgi:hypothetical protein
VALGDARGGRHELAGCAVAALEGVKVAERPLDGAQLAAVGEPFDGGDLAAVALHGERQAPVHPRAVDEHGARAAGALVAALLGAGEPDLLAQPVEQGGAGMHDRAHRAAVDPDGDVDVVGVIKRHDADTAPSTRGTRFGLPEERVSAL